jgi:hypothetical protein
LFDAVVGLAKKAYIFVLSVLVLGVLGFVLGNDFAWDDMFLKVRWDVGAFERAQINLDRIDD